MHKYIINKYELKDQTNNVRRFQFRDKIIHLGEYQRLELSKTEKTFKLIQEDENHNYIGSKTFRTNSCLFWFEYYD